MHIVPSKYKNDPSNIVEEEKKRSEELKPPPMLMAPKINRRKETIIGDNSSDSEDYKSCNEEDSKINTVNTIAQQSSAIRNIKKQVSIEESKMYTFYSMF